ncbi:MAG: transposase [Bacteroidaceae bacterium]|nr:transposase [Bacteroidaceae bacterium]
MAKIRHLSEIQQEIAFTEFDFYQRYTKTFKTSELGRIKSHLPLREMAISFNLAEERPMHKRVKRGRKSFFTPEGKVALAFLKMYTGLSAPKLMEALNGNIHYQIFCGIRISPENQLTNYKLIDGILLELSRKLKVQEQQKVLADAWKPYMKNLDTVYTDASCYESLMRFPTDVKLLWECTVRAYKMVRGKENKTVKFGAKCNNILIDGISFIEKVSFNAFNEGTRLRHCISLAQKLTGVPVKKVGGDQGYSGNDNRTFCKDNKIETSFTQKGRTGMDEVKNATKRELARVRATAMEGSFGTQKEHYGLRKIAARIKSTEIMLIFFGIHTANVVNLARRESSSFLSQPDVLRMESNFTGVVASDVKENENIGREIRADDRKNDEVNQKNRGNSAC